MSRALGIVIVLLVICLVLPTLAEWATKAVPVLIALLLFVLLVGFLSPAGTRGGR